jgi:hypothetical protein
MVRRLPPAGFRSTAFPAATSTPRGLLRVKVVV